MGDSSHSTLDLSLFIHSPSMHIWTIEEARACLNNIQNSSKETCSKSSSPFPPYPTQIEYFSPSPNYFSTSPLEDWQKLTPFPSPSQNPIGYQNLERFIGVCLDEIWSSQRKAKLACLNTLIFTIKRMIKVFNLYSLYFSFSRLKDLSKKKFRRTKQSLYPNQLKTPKASSFNDPHSPERYFSNYIDKYFESQEDFEEDKT